MKRTFNSRLLVLAFTAVVFGILTGFNFSGFASDGDKTFTATEQFAASTDFAYSAKCADGKSDAKENAGKEVKCGDGKCGDGKADAAKSAEKDSTLKDSKTAGEKAAAKDAKCGDGKCGDGKATEKKSDKKDAKCGDGKCG